MVEKSENLTTAFPRQHLGKLDELKVQLFKTGATPRVPATTAALVFAVEAGLRELAQLEAAHQGQERG